MTKKIELFYRTCFTKMNFCRCKHTKTMKIRENALNHSNSMKRTCLSCKNAALRRIHEPTSLSHEPTIESKNWIPHPQWTSTHPRTLHKINKTSPKYNKITHTPAPEILYINIKRNEEKKNTHCRPRGGTTPGAIQWINNAGIPMREQGTWSNRPGGAVHAEGEKIGRNRGIVNLPWRKPTPRRRAEREGSRSSAIHACARGLECRGAAAAAGGGRVSFFGMEKLRRRRWCLPAWLIQARGGAFGRRRCRRLRCWLGGLIVLWLVDWISAGNPNYRTTERAPTSNCIVLNESLLKISWREW